MLTLSATPIPRTMQMSLSGVRDMSLILTPPDDRRPVEVHVGEWDPDVVSAAIRRELARGGQVYYVSNRVRSIEEAVRSRAGRGRARRALAWRTDRWTKEQLETVMEEFAAGQLDVLVATTIIESRHRQPAHQHAHHRGFTAFGPGADVPAEGPRGPLAPPRRTRTSCSPNTSPSPRRPQARLTALDEHTDLGSGMRIAMRDLEIRGAGSLMGAEQSGNMSAVGFDLFAQMLDAAVNATREGDRTASEGAAAGAFRHHGEPARPHVSARGIRARSRRAGAVVPQDRQRCTPSRLWTTSTRTCWRSAPRCRRQRSNLFEKARLKAFANEHGIKLVSVSAGKLTVEPFVLTKSQASSLRRKAGRYPADKKKMVVPLRVVVPGYGKAEEEGDAGLLTNVLAYLQGLVADAKESGERPASGRGQAPAPAKKVSRPSRSTATRASASGSGAKRSTRSGSRSTRAQSLGVTNYVGRRHR